MTTIIGIDPHPQHHTVAALDAQGQVQGVEQFPNSPVGLEACLAWLEDLGEVRLAVEGPTQTFFALWLTRFLAEGLVVVPIPTQQVRERRGRRKTDPQDAVLIARVLQAEPDRPALTSPAWLRSLQELTRARRHLAQQLQADRMRLRTAQTPAVQTSLERVVTALAGEVQELEGQIQQQVQALAPQLLGLLGVGPVIAGVLLAEVGDIQRFRSKDHFASYCGAAPVPWESGASKHVRVNRGGNRRLNWALHIIARTRLRIDPDSQALVARKKQEGKTHREAIRVLKTYLARQLYSVLLKLLSPGPKHIATY
jgi:transposase